MICPLLSFRGKGEERRVECEKEKCAWWYDGECAMAQIVKQLAFREEGG